MGLANPAILEDQPSLRLLHDGKVPLPYAPAATPLS
jgi:hypothetical protein